LIRMQSHHRVDDDFFFLLKLKPYQARRWSMEKLRTPLRSVEHQLSERSMH
jgi:hypothetical protein